MRPKRQLYAVTSDKTDVINEKKRKRNEKKSKKQKKGNKKDTEGEEECEDAIGDNDDNEDTSICGKVVRISHGYNSDEAGVFDTAYDSHGTYTNYNIDKNITKYMHNCLLLDEGTHQWTKEEIEKAPPDATSSGYKQQRYAKDEGRKEWNKYLQIAATRWVRNPYIYVIYHVNIINIQLLSLPALLRK